MRSQCRSPRRHHLLPPCRHLAFPAPRLGGQAPPFGVPDLGQDPPILRRRAARRICHAGPSGLGGEALGPGHGAGQPGDQNLGLDGKPRAPQSPPCGIVAGGGRIALRPRRPPLGLQGHSPLRLDVVGDCAHPGVGMARGSAAQAQAQVGLPPRRPRRFNLGADARLSIGSIAYDASDRGRYWDTVERAERRDGRVQYRLIAELPFEPEMGTDGRATILDRLGGVFDGLDLPWHGVVHVPPPEGDPRNWHLHLAYHDRPIEARVPEPGGTRFVLAARKVRGAHDRAFIPQLRDAYADIVNDVYRQAGLARRFDPSRYEDAGVTKPVTVHLGNAAAAKERQGVATTGGTRLMRAERSWRLDDFLRRMEGFAARDGEEVAKAFRIVTAARLEGLAGRPLDGPERGVTGGHLDGAQGPEDGRSATGLAGQDAAPLDAAVARLGEAALGLAEACRTRIGAAFLDGAGPLHVGLEGTRRAERIADADAGRRGRHGARASGQRPPRRKRVGTPPPGALCPAVVASAGGAGDGLGGVEIDLPGPRAPGRFLADDGVGEAEGRAVGAEARAASRDRRDARVHPDPEHAHQGIAAVRSDQPLHFMLVAVGIPPHAQ